jgi:hypothetical protein
MIRTDLIDCTKAELVSGRLTGMSIKVLAASLGDCPETFHNELAKIAPAIGVCKQTVVAHINQLRGAYYDGDEYLDAIEADHALREVHAAFLDAIDRLQSIAEAAELVGEHGQDAVQASMAAAFEPVRDDLEDASVRSHPPEKGDSTDALLPEDDPGDEHEGLSSTFAQACAQADAGKLPANISGDGNEPTEGLTGEALVTVQYRNDRAKGRIPLPRKKTEQELAEFWRKVDSPSWDPNNQRHHPVAESTINAVTYLIREGDPQRLDAFLAGRSADERVAMLQEIDRRKNVKRKRKEATP